MQIASKRCDFNMTQCEHFQTFVIRDVCKIFDQSNQIWSDAMARTQPRAKCPFKAGVVKIINATLDFTYLTYLPLEGYTYIVTYKIYKPIPSVRHKKQMVFCLIGEASVFQSSKSSGEPTKTFKPNGNRQNKTD